MRYGVRDTTDVGVSKYNYVFMRFDCECGWFQIFQQMKGRKNKTKIH